MRDVDASTDSRFFRHLASRTLRPLPEIRATTLRAYEGVICDAASSNRKIRWVLPLGTCTAKRRIYGVQCCARCLAEDQEPYFRRAWRLAFFTECVHHRMPLLDRCPVCEAPLLYHLADIGHRSDREADPMPICRRCKFDMRCASVSGTPEADPILVLLDGLAGALTERWAELPGHGPVHVIPYLTGIRKILVLLASSRFGPRMRRAVSERYGLEFGDWQGVSGHPEFESFRQEDRRTLLRLTAALVSDWPHGFVEVCREVRLWACEAMDNLKPPPFWYWRVVSEHLDRTLYSQTVEEIAWSLAKNEEVFDGLYFPTHKRVRFIPIWNASGINVSPHKNAGARRAAKAARRAGANSGGGPDEMVPGAASTRAQLPRPRDSVLRARTTGPPIREVTV